MFCELVLSKTEVLKRGIEEALDHKTEKKNGSYEFQEFEGGKSPVDFVFAGVGISVEESGDEEEV